MKRRLHRSVRVTGLTLMETLVTLVIVSLVAGLVAQGLYQIARAERGLEGLQLQSRLASLHERWVLDALEGLVVRGADEAELFTGDAKALAGSSTRLPIPADTGAETFRLELKAWEDRRGTSLLMDFPNRRQKVELMRWPVTDLAWVFVDDAGKTQGQWPPEPLWRGQSLPRTIELRSKDGQQVFLLASPIHNGRVPVKRTDAEAPL